VDSPRGCESANVPFRIAIADSSCIVEREREAVGGNRLHAIISSDIDSPIAIRSGSVESLVVR
jgi:hypothetical protein